MFLKSLKRNAFICVGTEVVVFIIPSALNSECEQKGVWPLNYKIINSAHIRDIYFFYISELIPPPMAFHLNFFHKEVLIEIKPFLAVANHYLIGSYETAWIKLLGITGMLWTVPVCSGQYPSCMNERRNNEN